ncbi:translation initiation factor IF-2 N-terminal domain-containing protein, partial [Isoptericola sp. NPDC057391]|uniref:translation initiation factor IF-2 N-terminal domain-containing protein n=1 Tax=Isoptericola sp. NPDC057391 TaxID=3346117 RepID=UPI00363BB871
MAKIRVHELAKQLGVESKTLLADLKSAGEFVRSASSTLEAPVERAMRDKYKDAAPASSVAPASKAEQKPAPAKPAPKPAQKPTPAPEAEAPAAPAAAATPAAAAPEAPAKPAARPGAPTPG